MNAPPHLGPQARPRRRRWRLRLPRGAWRAAHAVLPRGRPHRGTATAARGALRGARGSSAQIGAGAPGGGQQVLQALVTCGDQIGEG